MKKLEEEQIFEEVRQKQFLKQKDVKRSLLGLSYKKNNSSESNEKMSDLTNSDEVDPFEDNRELYSNLKSLSEITSTMNSFILVSFTTKRYYVAKVMEIDTDNVK